MYYGLTLANGLHWTIGGDTVFGKECAVRLAAIMRLAPAEPVPPSILYTEEDRSDPGGMDEVQHRLIRIRFNPETDESRVILPYTTGISFYAELWASLYAIHRRVIQHGGLPIHCAYIEHNGKGYLIAATGGTGKSTCCRRLPKRDGWRAISDDQALVVRLSDGTYAVHPLPTWSNFMRQDPPQTEWQVEQSLPLAGIYFMRQSEQEYAEPVGQGEGATLIYSACATVVLNDHDPANPAELSLRRKTAWLNAVAIAQSIPCYRLGVRLDGEYWKLIDNG